MKTGATGCRQQYLNECVLCVLMESLDYKWMNVCRIGLYNARINMHWVDMVTRETLESRNDRYAMNLILTMRKNDKEISLIYLN